VKTQIALKKLSFTCIKIVAVAMGTKADEEAALQEASKRINEHTPSRHRNQTILFPDKLDKYVDEENPVRFIGAFKGMSILVRTQQTKNTR